MRLLSALFMATLALALATPNAARQAAPAAQSLKHLKDLKPGDYLDNKPWDDPAFKAALRAVLAPKATLSRLYAGGPVIDKLKPFDQAVLAWGCRAHECSTVNAQVFIEPDADRLFVCWHDDERDAAHDWWLAKGRRPLPLPPRTCNRDYTAIAAYRAHREGG
jgi:hypothetical protein